MKKISMLLMLLSAGCVSYAQDISQGNVPAVVVNSFQQKFPNQTNVDWEMKNGLFEAEFEIKKMDHSVYIDSTGKITTYKKEIPASELPAVVAATIKKDFSGYKIEDIKRIEAPTGVTYKVELEQGEAERKVTFSIDGKVIENIAD